MILEMKVPSPGESISEVEIAQWLVKDGDYVEKDQDIAEIDSDKATLALPAEASGIIKILVPAGSTVAVGDVVCTIDTSAQAPAKAAHQASTPKKAEEQTPAPKKEEPKPAPVAEQKPTSYATGTPSPAARKLMEETGVSLSAGTGRDGRITKADVLKAAEEAKGRASMGSPGTGSRSTQRKRMSALRRKLSERLVSVKNETAMLTTFNEVDMKAIYDLRAEYKEAFAAKHGVNLGFMSFFTLACVSALKAFPQVNSMIDGEDMVSFDFCDISIAVSGPKGLMVPVLRNAENMTFAGVEKEIKRLATRVRDGVITVDEMTGGTFTITNGGVFGSMLSTPIINPPQSAILGMHNVVERPVVRDGQIVIRPIMYVALSYDHRIIDGRESVGFLVHVKECLENPVEKLMNGDPQRALEL
ncbi:2-oxoglutarate dehydrogenase complex dihydrolipoyllysine-residue succinyltransferase [Thermaurantimonas aggregans]|uniref:2-oxoglutarate dehydrogenase complex dihydrolipoyllysine-residue succinyltransferase n=1 Tax=Thermaurantimonas aggregans TaxID=2173829 RepID=UPI0023F54720|nr:2-oxoglutarate dehydrogenase complex dihydrolipoyllysine-residue succinyltransferase [Thermaurantimonas aggregans]MCX8148846.1 2-oxoglutarate dehydrogenase complex dihydrolipoyllysine-residue succinyltransferase [Thermaurantimonas aggregans]